jgi:hypothetical protein
VIFTHGFDDLKKLLGGKKNISREFYILLLIELDCESTLLMNPAFQSRDF